MTAPSGTMLPVGARYCAVFALNSDGIIAATSTTPYEGVQAAGVKAFTPNCAPPRTPTLAPSSSLGDTQRVDNCVSTYRIVSATCIGATEPTILNSRLLNHAPASEASTVRQVEPSHVRPAPAPTQPPPVDPMACARASASV